MTLYDINTFVVELNEHGYRKQVYDIILSKDIEWCKKFIAKEIKRGVGIDVNGLPIDYKNYNLDQFQKLCCLIVWNWGWGGSDYFCNTHYRKLRNRKLRTSSDTNRRLYIKKKDLIKMLTEIKGNPTIIFTTSIESGRANMSFSNGESTDFNINIVKDHDEIVNLIYGVDFDEEHDVSDIVNDGVLHIKVSGEETSHE